MFVNEPKQGLRLLVVSIIAVMLMVSDQRSIAFNNLRMRASIIVYPIQKLVDAPINWFYVTYHYLTMQNILIKENSKLCSQNLLLQAQLQKLYALEADNDRLNVLLNSTAKVNENFLVANIVHIDADPFTHQIVLDKGSINGVYVGQPVIDANGVMGTVVFMSALTSNVMLLTDASHAIPVKNIRNNIRAIAIGTGKVGILELQHIPNTMDMKVGDKLITSGLGGRFPVGYPIGEIIDVYHDSIKPFMIVKVKPTAELEKSQQVLLIQSQQQQGKDL